MTCKKHKQYKAIRPPRVKCPECERMYSVSQKSKKIIKKV